MKELLKSIGALWSEPLRQVYSEIFLGVGFFYVLPMFISGFAIKYYNTFVGSACNPPMLMKGGEIIFIPVLNIAAAALVTIIDVLYTIIHFSGLGSFADWISR